MSTETDASATTATTETPQTPAAPVAAPPARAPRNDAEAAQMEAAAEAAKTAKPEDGADPKDETPAEKQKRNASTYIDRLKAERQAERDRANDLAARLARYEAGQSAPAEAAPQSGQASAPAQGATDAEPTLESCDYDYQKWQRELTRWTIREENRAQQQSQQQATQQQDFQKTLDTYSERVAEFVDDHPDWEDTIGSMQFVPPPQSQIAIMQHPRGVEVTYFLAKNPEEALRFAQTPPQYVPGALELIASRLSAAQSEAPSVPAAETQPAPVAQPVRKISAAPAPIPAASGKSSTAPAPEKMTDDDWYKADKERRRKR